MKRPRNLGRWPARKRTIFDTASHRRTSRALDHLAHARQYVCDTAGTLDPAGLWIDADSRAALELIQQAWLSVHDSNEQAQTAARFSSGGKS